MKLKNKHEIIQHNIRCVLKLIIHHFTRDLITKMRLNISMLNFDLNLMMHSISTSLPKISTQNALIVLIVRWRVEY